MVKFPVFSPLPPLRSLKLKIPDAFSHINMFSLLPAPRTKRNRPKSDVEVSDFSEFYIFLKKKIAHSIWPPRLMGLFNKAHLILYPESGYNQINLLPVRKRNKTEAQIRNQ